MPTAITIPISIFELAIAYDKPAIRLLADRVGPLQALFDALAPWNPTLDDMEVVTTGKPSEQGVKLKVPAQSASFFFGASGCRFTRDAANWSDADNINKLLGTALNALEESTGVTLGKRLTTLSLHLQPKTVSYKDILRNFVAPSILRLEGAPSEAMAIVTRWPGRRITIDGSAALANAIFLQTEREFDAAATFDDMKHAILNDELELFRILDVEEVDA